MGAGTTGNVAIGSANQGYAGGQSSGNTNSGAGGAFAVDQVENRADRTQVVGKSHVGTAMQDAAAGAQVGSHQHLRDHPVGRDRDQAYPHQPGKQGLQHLLH